MRVTSTTSEKRSWKGLSLLLSRMKTERLMVLVVLVRRRETTGSKRTRRKRRKKLLKSVWLWEPRLSEKTKKFRADGVRRPH